MVVKDEEEEVEVGKSGAVKVK